MRPSRSAVPPFDRENRHQHCNLPQLDTFASIQTRNQQVPDSYDGDRVELLRIQPPRSSV